MPLDQIGGATEYIMVIVYLASMLGSTLLFSFVTDNQQKYMFAAMSVFFVFFIIRVPAGVGMYWITTNIWTIGQQGMIKRTMGHHFPLVQKKRGGSMRSSRARAATAPKAAAAKTAADGAKAAAGVAAEPARLVARRR